MNAKDQARARQWLTARRYAELPPDERERIEADPLGQDALAFAIMVELQLQSCHIWIRPKPSIQGK